MFYPVICHPNILYILIQFKSFYRFAQGYLWVVKVESREKLLDVGTRTQDMQNTYTIHEIVRRYN